MQFLRKNLFFNDALTASFGGSFSVWDIDSIPGEGTVEIWTGMEDEKT